jgi:hypothetical protein
MTVQSTALKIAAVLSAASLLAACRADTTNVQLRNMSGSPAVMVLKQSRLRLANGQVFELTPSVQANGLQSTARHEPIVRLAPVGGADQCFILRFEGLPDTYYGKGSPRRLGVELGQDGSLSAFPPPGKDPRVAVKLPTVACGA